MTLLQRISTIIDHATLSTAVYTPKGAYTGSLPTKTVKKGSSGTSVKNLQKFLNWCINAGLKVDGKAGSNTVKKIKSWQKAYGLKADGVFGSKSRSKAKAIVRQYAPQPTPTPAPAPTPTPSPTPAYYPTANALKIVDRATAYAWPYGTSAKKSSYKKGSARSSYKSALKKYMGKKYSKRASQSDCGFFVATCVRAAGLGSSFKALPGSYKSKYPSVPSTFSIVLKGKKIPSGFLLPGDIIRYRKRGGQHTLLYMGSGKIAHAGRNNWFPKIVGNSKSYNKSNVKKSSIQVLRAR